MSSSPTEVARLAARCPPAEKPSTGHLRGVYMPLIRIGANQAHCLGSLQQSHRIAAGLHRIAQHEYGEAFGQELQGHWLGFAVRSHGVAAARQNQDGRAYTVRFHLLAVVGHIAKESRLAAINANDGLLNVLHAIHHTRRE